MHFGGTAIVPLQEGEQHLGNETATLHIEPADNTEINQLDITLFGDKDISRMQVGMEIAIHKHHMKKECRSPFAQMHQVMSRRSQMIALIDRYTTDPFGHQHLSGGVVPHHLRHTDPIDF